MRRSTISVTVILVFVLALLGGGGALAYTLMLKDGTTMVIRHKYEVEGDKALLTLLNGSTTLIPLAEIDVERTEKENSGVNLGAAVVLGEGGAERLRMKDLKDSVRERTLTDLIRERRVNEPEKVEGEAAHEDAATGLRRTAGGFTDLLLVRRLPVEPAGANNDLTGLLLHAGLKNFKLYAGTREDRILVEHIANNADEVFSALVLLTKALGEFRQPHPEINAFEVLMSTAGRLRSGQFLLSPENAPLLVNQRMTASDFFLEFVQY